MLAEYARADRAGLRRRRHLRHAPPQAGAVQGRRDAAHERRRASSPRAAPSGPGSSIYPTSAARARCSPIVIICELTALVLALARNEVALGFWTDLGAHLDVPVVDRRCAAPAMLCVLRVYLSRQSLRKGSAIVLRSPRSLVMRDLIGGVLARHALDWARRTLRCSRTTTGPSWCATWSSRWSSRALALRYFYVTHEWRRNVELQAQARVHALQARIRPHFLFNSMNTIAALTRSNPARAEEAVQDLADLFRANLSEKRNQIPLADEIDIARTYQRIEQLRLGDRLQVEWEVDALPRDALVPGLTLQPLLENAIYHGIEPRAGRRRGHRDRRIQQGHDHHRRPQSAAGREPHHARRQPPGARQHQGTPGSHVRRARHGQGRPLRR